MTSSDLSPSHVRVLEALLLTACAEGPADLQEFRPGVAPRGRGLSPVGATQQNADAYGLAPASASL